MKRAFTLIEVNLAMLIMAGGIFAIVGLYAYGFRENRQSNEDVASAAYADAVISPLVMALTATNVKWSAFSRLENFPRDQGERRGWATYVDNDWVVNSNPDGTAQDVFRSVIDEINAAMEGEGSVSADWPTSASGNLNAGLVVMHEENSAIVRIGFRASRLPSMLLSAPLYYTEARFQGLVDK